MPKHSSLEKECSAKCHYSKPKKKKEKKFKTIKPRSTKRAKHERVYLAKRIEFLHRPENMVCPVTGQRATEVHHKKGRVGNLLLDENYWLGVSHEGHKYIEEHPEEAKARGWSVSRLW